MIEFRNNSKVSRSIALASVIVLATMLLVSAGSFLSSVGMYAPTAQVVQFASAQSAEHGLGLTKVCIKVQIGSNNTCTFTATNLDEFGDSVTINNAADTMLAPYPGAPVTHTKLGGAQIKIISITDNAPTGDTTCVVDGSLPCVIGPGDRVRFQDTSFVMSVAGSIPDTASVSWTDLCDNPNTVSCDPFTAQSATAGSTTTVINPSISVEKSLSTSKVESGGQINVTATVTNTGSVTLTGITAVDTEAGTLTCDDTTLTAGQSTDCVGSFNPTQSGTNTVNATGNHQLGTVSDTDSEDFTVIVPGIEVEKSLSPSKVLSGGQVNVTATVTNNGTVTLTGLTASDTEAGTLTCDDTTLTAGQSTDCVGSFNPTQSGTNTVTATADYQLGQVSDTDSEDFTVINPSITVDKTCESIVSSVPGFIQWTIVVTNTGDVSLDTTVTDTEHGVVFSGSMAPSAIETIVLNDTGLQAGTYNDTVTAVGSHQLGDVRDSDTASCVISNPQYTFDKDAVETSVNAGETIHYNFVVNNTGDVPLDIATINLADSGIDLASLSGPTESGTQDNMLQPGETATWTGTHVTTADDCPEYPNTATVSGIVYQEQQLPSQQDSDSVGVICAPEYTFDKDAVETSVNAGETIHYNFVVNNTGNVALNITSINLADSGIDLASLSGPTESGTQDNMLQPGETATWTGTHVTTADDCPEYPNTATVSGIVYQEQQLPSQQDSDSVIVECPAVTRTIGYWGTHLAQANDVWNNDVSADHKQWCDGFAVDSTAKVMSGFWSSISRESDGAKRTSLEQARMQLGQQLIGAILNNAAFGSSPDSTGTTIDEAIDAFCGTDRAAILDAAGDMGAFNQSGDTLSFPDGFVNSSATPAASKQAATEKPFWDQDGLPSA